MRRLIDRCAGIDVGQALLVVCVRLASAGGVTEEVRSFGATTPDLLALHDWLSSLGVTHVAMESTGVYWKAPYYVLEDDFQVLLVNAAHLKHVPGRKTDVIDAQWIAEILSFGLLRPSFVPPKSIRELRDLTRYRKALIRARTSEINRLHKVLEDAGVKLATVATDVMGVSGREMMRALIDGVADPDALADLARARLRTKLPQLRKALTARFRDHHAFLLGRMLSHIEAAEEDIAAVSERITELISPWQPAVTILDSITGVGRRAAEVILAEIGPDMSQFPTAGHLASWAGRCPGQRESAGKRGSAKPRKGSPWLADTLVECAWAAVKTKDTYLSAYFRQVMRRQGKQKAIMAVAHKILVTAWNLLSTGALYEDPGAGALRKATDDQLRRRAVRQLEALGYRVTVEPAEGCAA
ncbi:MAG: IS110 family transposase [Actinomycetota bacterium]